MHSLEVHLIYHPLSLSLPKKIHMPSKTITARLAVLALIASSTVGLAATAIVSPISTPAAQANWFTDMFSFMPSGIYIKIDNDHRYYYGDYIRTGQPQFGEDSTWEITYNGQVAAHGYGRTPSWVWSLVNKWFSGQ
jgi:hypothetical protein